MSFIDFSSIGESVVFIVIAYGCGHIIQAFGNFFESIFWFLLGGMPTQWLTKKSWLGGTLFEESQQADILKKVHNQFKVVAEKDYGRDVYNWLSLQKKTTEKRIDLFNANYALFRGLSVSFYFLTGLVLCYFSWKLALIPFLIGVRANFRMYQ